MIPRDTLDPIRLRERLRQVDAELDRWYSYLSRGRDVPPLDADERLDDLMEEWERLEPMVRGLPRLELPTSMDPDEAEVRSVK